MSTRSCIEALQEAQQDLETLLLKENPPIPPKPEKVRAIAYRSLKISYIKYIRVAHKLEYCYDQLIQPQKRQLVRQLLDGTLGRVLELKQEMVNFMLSEVHSFEDILFDLKLTPDDVEVPIPHYFTAERAAELKSRAEKLHEIMIKYQLIDAQETEETLTVDQAVLRIQIMERARQGRLRAKFMREIYLKQQRDKSKGVRDKPTIDPHSAALKIQQVWRGYSTWKKIQKAKDDEMVFLGMIQPPQSNRQKDLALQVAKNEDSRRSIQAAVEKDYQKAMIQIKDEIVRQEKASAMDVMKEEIRNWFHNTWEMTGKFADYPTDEDGGYLAITKQAQLELQMKETEGSKKGSAKQVQTWKKVKLQQEEEEGYISQPSVFLENLEKVSNAYTETWKDSEESFATRDTFNTDVIKHEKREEVMKELRQQVDILMKQELEHLKNAVLRDQGKKVKTAKKAKKKGKASKRKRRRRKERDLTAQKSLDALYEELVREGIIIPYPQVKLSSFIGNDSHGEPKGDPKLAHLPSLACVRRMVAESCIIPLGSEAVHQKGPLTRSVLIVGPRYSGKTMLVHIICTEVGATLFDLSASNLAGKYPGRDGLKMLMHLVHKIGRLLQPSVILIDEVEKVFLKKVSKTDKTDPKRIKKDLTKLVKGITPDDRVLILGTSFHPFDTDMKGLTTTFTKIILIPKPDYSSRFALWSRFIQLLGGQENRFLDISTIAKVSAGYAAGCITQATAKVVSCHN